MYKSQLLKFRKKKKLSIAQLCEITQLSQYQHIIYEASIHAIPIDIAVRYCSALDVTFEQLFPGFKKTIKGLSNSQIETLLSVGKYDPEKLDQMLKIGLELDTCSWTVTANLASGYVWQREIPASSARHIEASAYSGYSVLTFDTHHSRIVMHCKGVNQIQVTFEGDRSSLLISDEELIDQPSPDSWDISVFLKNSKESIEIGTEEYPSDDYENLNRLQDIFYYIDLSAPDMSGNYEYAWQDEDGEVVWLNKENIAIFEVPLGLLETRIRATMEEIYDELYVDE